jgi:hypothetical protein
MVEGIAINSARTSSQEPMPAFWGRSEQFLKSCYGSNQPLIEQRFQKFRDL